MNPDVNNPGKSDMSDEPQVDQKSKHIPRVCLPDLQSLLSWINVERDYHRGYWGADLLRNAADAVDTIMVLDSLRSMNTSAEEEDSLIDYEEVKFVRTLKTYEGGQDERYDFYAEIVQVLKLFRPLVVDMHTTNIVHPGPGIRLASMEMEVLIGKSIRRIVKWMDDAYGSDEDEGDLTQTRSKIGFHNDIRTDVGVSLFLVKSCVCSRADRIAAR